MMRGHKKTAPEAAATAPRALDVALRKSTVLICPNRQTDASAFSYVGGEK